MDSFPAVSQDSFDRCENLRVGPTWGSRTGFLPAKMVAGLLLLVTGCGGSSPTTTRIETTKSPPPQSSEGTVSNEGTTVGNSQENRAADNKSQVGDGLHWNKPLPLPKQVISYESWLRQHRHPAGLGLLEQYVAEMRLLTQDSSSNGK